MNRQTKISIVSYLNTLPYHLGIENSKYIRENAIIERDTPAICAKKLINDEVDIGLIPVASIPKIKNPQIITDFCIGSLREIDSVLLVSAVELSRVKNIYLDYQSKTSVLLTKMLADKFWKISPRWIEANKGYEKKIGGETAGVIIGDRALVVNKSKYKHTLDLSNEWYNYTGLPFVFACWVTNKPLGLIFLDEFEKAIELGIRNKKYYLDQLKHKPEYRHIDLYDYILNKVNYTLDKPKIEAMKLFLKLAGLPTGSIE